MMLTSVSVLMPCSIGRFAKTALNCFFSQTYKGSMELVVIDNTHDDELVEELIRRVEKLPEERRAETLKYVPSPIAPIGAIRNRGIAEASGDIVIHFDADDWQHPDRVGFQVARLTELGKAVTGFHSGLYYNEDTGGTFGYHYSPGRPHEPYAYGANLAYTREWWKKHPFPETNAEDRPFTDAALHAQQLDSCDGGQMIVCRIHGRNLVPKANYLGRHKQWPSVQRRAFPPELFDAIMAERFTSSAA